MRAEVVTGDTMHVYMPHMTNEEIYGCISGRLTMLGIREEEQDQPAGFCIVEILPEYIRLHRFYVHEPKKQKAVMLRLLNVIKDMPERDRLPVYAFDIRFGKDARAFGFVECDSKYFYETAVLADMRTLPLRKEPGMGVYFAENIPKNELLTELRRIDTDHFFQFPYANFDSENLGGSLVCLRNKEITACILLEENDKFIKIPGIYGKDTISLDVCFSVLKSLLKENYAADTRITFLTTSKNRKWDLNRYFKRIRKVPVRLLRLL